MYRYLFFLLLLCSCSSESSQLLSESEYENFGKKVINLLKKKKIDKLSDLFYPKSTFDVLNDSIARLQLKESAEIANLKSLRTQYLNEFKTYTENLSKLITDSSKVELSRVYFESESAHIVIVITVPKQFEVIDLELLTISDKTYIANVATYNTGINFGESFIWNSLNKLSYGWMGGEYMQALEELNNAHVYLERNQPERAWIAYNRIPPYFEYHPNFQIVKTRIAYQISDSLFEQSLYDWIGNNWDNKGFRYLKAFQYSQLFGDSTQTEVYLDSLEAQSGSEHLRNWVQTY